MKQTRGNVLLILYFACFLLLSLLPDFFADSLRTGIELCLKSLIPALFPHLFLSSFLVRSGAAASVGKHLQSVVRRLFRLGNSCTVVLLLGNLSGYPTGAKTVGTLYREKQITKAEAERLLFFSCNAGPGFIFGAVGGAVYGSAAVGISLFLIHIVASLLCGFLLPMEKSEVAATNFVAMPPKCLSVSFTESVCDAAVTMGKICAFVCLFSILVQGEQALLGKFKVLASLFAGVTELSSGCIMLGKANLSWTLKFMLTAGLVGFGGLCVMAQTMAVLAGTGLSVKPYLKGKLLHGIISALLAWPVSYFIRPLAAVSSQTVLLQPMSPLPWRIFSLGLVFLIFLQFRAGNSQTVGL